MANSITWRRIGSRRRFRRPDLGNFKLLFRGLWNFQALELSNLCHISNLSTRQGVLRRWRFSDLKDSIDRHSSIAGDAIHSCRAWKIFLWIRRVYRYILPWHLLLLLCQKLQVLPPSTETTQEAWRRMWKTLTGSRYRPSSLQSSD